MNDPSHDCKKVRATLWRYVDREMPAREMATISESLRECEDCQRAYEDCAREARLLRTGFVDTPFGGEGFVQRFQERAAKEGLDRVHPRRGRGSILSIFGSSKAKDRRRRETVGRGASSGVESDDEAFEGLISVRGSSPQRRRRLIAVAAMLLVIPAIIGLGIYFTESGQSPLGVYDVEGSGFVRILEDDSGGIHSDAQASGAFRSGMRFVVPAETTLKLRLGEGVTDSNAAQIEVVGPAELRVPQKSTVGEFLCHLELGKLRALVAERSADESFVISTPHHGIKVIGTVFVLETDGESTRLTVDEGKVAFGHPGVDGTIYDDHVVHAGESRTLKVGETQISGAKSSKTDEESDAETDPLPQTVAGEKPLIGSPVDGSPAGAPSSTGKPTKTGKPGIGARRQADLDNVVGPGAKAPTSPDGD